MRDFFLLEALADALLAGEPTVDSLYSRCARVLGNRWRWLRPLARRYFSKFGRGTRPRHRDVVQFLRGDANLQRALSKYSGKIFVRELLIAPQQMLPAPEKWDLPGIESAGDLASWLGLSPGELRWFADLRGLGYKQSQRQLRHYHYRILAKPFGAVRLIEAPKARLKDLQRQILIWILEKVPPHPAVHGFVKGRSIRTFVAPHVGQRVVLRMDLQDFFPTFGGVRIQNLFRTLGYPEAVADLLGGICTNATPQDVWHEIAQEDRAIGFAEVRRMYARPHLPQGAPTSPTLANISFYRADCRLSALAKSADAVLHTVCR